MTTRAFADLPQVEDIFDEDVIFEQSANTKSILNFEVTESYSVRHPLHVRAMKGDHSILEIENLHENNVFGMYDFRGVNPLHILAAKGIYHVLSYPKAEKVFDKNGFTPFHHFAYQDKHLDILIDCKEITQYKTMSGITPLHILAKRGIMKIIDHPAIAKIRDKNYNTLLHILAERSNVDLDKIVSHPESATVLDGNDNTVLHVLALSGKATDAILAHPKAHVVKNSIGSTPIHILAKRGKANVKNHPAFSKVKDNYGKTPADYFKA